MLRSLRIKNFAVVAELELEFGPGLHALTGETGAGKSILVEALGFLLGARGSVDWVRAGAAKLEVEGVFDRADLPADALAPGRSGEASVLVRRELDSGGKTRAWIDGRAVSVQALSAVGDGLVDFHGQHEHQTLLRPLAQLVLLDAYGGLEAAAAKTADAYRRREDLRRELETLRLSDSERLKRLDLARFQLTEIREADPKPGEEEELDALLPRLKNAERLRSFASQAHELLYDQEGSVQELLLKAGRAVEELARIDPALASASSSLEQARILVEEAAAGLSSCREAAEDPDRLDSILSRQEALSRLRRKYGPTAAEVLATKERLEAELSWLENSTERAGEVEASLAAAEKDYRKHAGALHKARMEAAARLSAAVVKELRGLGMPSARLSVSVELEEDRFSPTGSDEAEFLLAPNPGEPLKALKSIASGGELSRVMLALKTVLARADRVGVLVFDEVDAGVGGVVGRAVGERLAALGRRRQVLCVTHLAQVAGFAVRHFHVSKEVQGGRTTTRVERLDGRRRLETLAQMLGGLKVSAAGLKHARELLEESGTLEPETPEGAAR